VKKRNLKRDIMVMVRMNAEEKAMLKALADHYGTNPSTIIRLLLRQQHEAVRLVNKTTTSRGGRVAV
jgi:hypothetical protein